MSRHPTLKWAQRSENLYITVELPDAKDVKLKLEPEGRLYFSAKGGVDNIPYEIDITLYENVNVAESKSAVGLRNNVCYLVKKAEKKWWPRLLKQEGKPPVFVKVDWDKWVDEDEEEEKKFGADMDFGGMDFSKLNMGGPDEVEDDEDDNRDEDDDEMKAGAVAGGVEEGKADETPSTSKEAELKG